VPALLPERLDLLAPRRRSLLGNAHVLGEALDGVAGLLRSARDRLGTFDDGDERRDRLHQAIVEPVLRRRLRLGRSAQLLELRIGGGQLLAELGLDLGQPVGGARQLPGAL
jgi:hypothetical protein